MDETTALTQQGRALSDSIVGGINGALEGLSPRLSADLAAALATALPKVAPSGGSPDEAKHEQDDPEVRMEQALLAVIERPINAAIPNIPLGSIGVGGVSGLVLGEVIDGFAPPRNSAGEVNMTNILVKGAAAWGVVQFGGMLMTRQATLFATGALGIQILADLLPLDQWIATIVGWFPTGTTTSSARQRAHQPSAHRQTSRPSGGGYYDGVV